MSRLHIDGFESYDTLGFDYENDVFIEATEGLEGFTGNYCARFNATGEGRIYLDDVTTVIVSLKLNLIAVNGYFTIGINDDDAYLKIFLVSSIYVTIGIYDGDNSLKATFNYGISSQTNTFEFKIILTGSGEYTCYVRANGYNVINSSFTYGDNSTISYVKLFADTAGSDEQIAHIDDFVIDDEDWIGITEVHQVKPYANGTTNQWANNCDSTNFEVVDNIPHSTSHYIYTNTFGDIDLYKNYDLPITGRTIRSLMLRAISLQAGGPPPTQLVRGVVRIDSTNFEVESKVPGTLGTWKMCKYLIQNSPKTRSAWTESEINDMETGIKLIAG